MRLRRHNQVSSVAVHHGGVLTEEPKHLEHLVVHVLDLGDVTLAGGQCPTQASMTLLSFQESYMTLASNWLAPKPNGAKLNALRP